MNRVFVSYSRRNKIFAERIARDLSDAGLDVWVDFRQIHGGEMWRNEIFRGLERSDVIVVCLSPPAVASEWVAREVNTAREQGKMILPIMVEDAFADLEASATLSWMTEVQFIPFMDRYEEAFPQLLAALPGGRRIGPFDEMDLAALPNPFKGLEAFQQTDAAFFFGRERLIQRALAAMGRPRDAQFLAVVGASGSGKSSLVRAGLLPKLRQDAIPGADRWKITLITPGADPLGALATRLSPVLGEGRDPDAIQAALRDRDDALIDLALEALDDVPADAQLLLVIDQFEEVFTRAQPADAALFLGLIHRAATQPDSRVQTLITMRADFFDRLSQYPDVARLFERENMLIVTEMSTAELLRSIEGPVEAMRLQFEDGLAARILDDVRRQPGSLPLLQYALKALFERREGAVLTHAAYDAIGGVEQALARHAESVYSGLGPAQQDVMRRVLLRLVEVGDSSGEGFNATRRRVRRDELQFRGITDQAVDEVVSIMVAPESRLLVTTREIQAADSTQAPAITLEISHEALLRQWDRYENWILDNLEDLRYTSELEKVAADWANSGLDSSYLLRGNRLQRARDWQAEADATEAQRRLIEASLAAQARREEEERAQAARELQLQKAAANRLRALVGVLGVALIAAVGLILFAVDQSQRAIENEQVALDALDQAEASALEARSFALAANAERVLGNEDRDLAVALALDSVLIQAQNPPPESRLILANVGFAPGTRRLFPADAPLSSALLLEARELVIGGGQDGTLYAWDLDSGELRRSLPGLGDVSADQAPESQAPASQQQVAQQATTTGALTAIAQVPTDESLLIGTDRGLVLRLDLANETMTALYSDPSITRTINAIAVRPDSAYALAATADNRILEIDLQSGVISRVLSRHIGAVQDIAYVPTNPEQAVSVSQDSTIIVWDLAAGTPILRQLTGNPINAVALNEAGNGVAVSGANGVVQFWALSADGTRLTREPVQFNGHDTTATVNDLALSPDEQTLVSAGSDGRVILWDLTREDAIRAQYLGHSGGITGLDFSASGTRLLSASSDNTLRLWDVQGAAVLQDYPSDALGSTIGRFLPLGLSEGSGERAFVSGSSEGLLALWDLESGRMVRQIAAHEDAITALAVSPDGRQVLSGARDGRVRLWDLIDSGTLQADFLPHSSTVSALVFLDDGSGFISSGQDGSVVLQRFTGGDPITAETSATAAPESQAVQQQSGGDQIFTPEDEGISSAQAQYAVDLSSARRLLASGGDDARVWVWRIESGALLNSFDGHSRSVRAVAFNADGTQIASGSSSGQILLWEVDSGAVVRQFDGHTGSIRSLQFSPDGDVLLSASDDGSLRAWDITSGFEVRNYALELGSVDFVDAVFSASADTVLSGLSNGGLRLWRMYPDTGTLLAWTLNNRYVRELSCRERELFRLEPFCSADQPSITRALPDDLPTLTQVGDSLLRLSVGVEAVVTLPVGPDTTLNLREAPSLEASIRQQMPAGTRLTLNAGPVDADTLLWWEVTTESGETGWAAEAVPDRGAVFQTLVPLSAWEVLGGP